MEPPLKKACSFNLRPLVLAAAGVSCGVFLAYRLNGTLAVSAACLFLCCALLALRRRAGLSILLFAICAGVFRMLAALPALPAEGACTLTGCIAETPAAKRGYVYVLLYDAVSDGSSVEGRVQVRFAEQDAEKLKCGDVISLSASLRIPGAGRAGSSFDARAYYLSEGVSTLAYARGAPTVLAHRIDLRYRLAKLREEAGALIGAAFGTEAPLARALLLNDRTLLPEEAYSAFRDAGAAHILALSGLHVSIFAGLLARLLPKRYGRLRLFLIGAFLFAYCVFTGFPASLVRAAVMSVCMLAAPLLLRRYDMASALGLALLIILLFSPASLFSAGLQLSFGAAAAIAMLMPPLRRLFRRLPGFLSGSLSVSLAATLGTLPLTLHYFGRLPLYSLLANILIVPFVAFALPLALLSVLLFALFPGASALTVPARAALGALGWASASFAALPGAVLTFSPPPIPASMLLYGAMLALSQYCLKPLREKLLYASACLAAASIILLSAVF